jgi:Sortase domain
MDRVQGSRRGTVAAAAATGALVVAGLVLGGAGLRGHDGPPQPAAAAALPAVAPPAAAPPAAAPGGHSPSAKPSAGASAEADPGPVLPPSPPVRLVIPAIRLSTGNLVRLGTNPDGSLEVPDDVRRAGWWTPGPPPGSVGPAVIAGHVDSTRGPAVFYRLGQLGRGQEVRVVRADGRVARFTVDGVERFAKDAFPTERVYGATSRAELRLITCGGDFDRRTGHYVDNVVAFAHLVP